MSAKFCSECGTELDQGVKFCRNCGMEISTKTNETDTESAEIKTGTPRPAESGAIPESSGSNTMFRATSGLIAGWFVFLILGAIIPSGTLIGLATVCFFISLVTMYVDLRDLEERLWDTRPILWIIGALLLYIVIAPLYIYKRRQV